MEICLKKWQPGNAEILTGLIQKMDRTYTSNRLPNPYTLPDGEQYISSALEKEGKSGIYRAIVADGKHVGNISVVQSGDVAIVDSEIGYFIIGEYWNMGIATEAVRLICPIAFDKLDIQRISAFVFAENAASAKVLERNGFALEGNMKNALFKYGKIHDQLIYGKYR